MTASKISNSPASYDDVKLVMDLALKKPGLRYECATYGGAINFKQRCNKYRNLLRGIAQEQVLNIPGHRAEVAYDRLVIRQLNDDGDPDRRGRILVFETREPMGKITDPETGEIIDPFNTLTEQKP